MEKSSDESNPDNAPDHIRDATQASNALHSRHHRSASSFTRLMQFLTQLLVHPASVLILCGLSIGWIAVNMLALNRHWPAFDAYPFPLLGTIMGFSAVVTTLIILSSQQHENKMSEERARITLELAMINDQKLTKAIMMLNELREDLPNVPNKQDAQIEKIVEAVDSKSLLENLEKSREAGE